jgi:hypothetical protein
LKVVNHPGFPYAFLCFALLYCPDRTCSIPVSVCCDGPAAKTAAHEPKPRQADRSGISENSDFEYARQRTAHPVQQPEQAVMVLLPDSCHLEATAEK